VLDCGSMLTWDFCLDVCHSAPGRMPGRMRVSQLQITWTVSLHRFADRGQHRGVNRYDSRLTLCSVVPGTCDSTCLGHQPPSDVACHTRNQRCYFPEARTWNFAFWASMPTPPVCVVCACVPCMPVVPVVVVGCVILCSVVPAGWKAAGLSEVQARQVLRFTKPRTDTEACV